MKQRAEFRKQQINHWLNQDPANLEILLTFLQKDGFSKIQSVKILCMLQTETHSLIVAKDLVYSSKTWSDN
jgi:hypothetical protein